MAITKLSLILFVWSIETLPENFVSTNLANLNVFARDFSLETVKQTRKKDVKFCQNSEKKTGLGKNSHPSFKVKMAV